MHAATSFLSIAVSCLVLFAVSPCPAEVSVDVSIRVAPPALPVYDQPECPAAGYLWVPGYWAYGDDGYYWVPGIWVLAPRPGLLWTPGYWGWSDGLYAWHEGYWGRHVGFYGGVCYGFGYTGVGYAGGYWHEGVFRYNRSVTNVNVSVVHATYTKVVVTNTATVNRVSFNGGAGGIPARPTAVELVAVHDHHVVPVPMQIQHQREAVANRALLASENHGQPQSGALAKRATTTAASDDKAQAAAPSKQSGKAHAGNNGHQKSKHAPRGREM
jgi:WXXGXW repeat (2 copies)